jgi:hypothetical protein
VVDFGPFAFYFSVVLGGGLGSEVAHFVLVHVDAGTVHFAPVDLRVLQRDDLPSASHLGGLGCVEGVLDECALLQVLRRDGCRRVFLTTRVLSEGVFLKFGLRVIPQVRWFKFTLPYQI